MLLEAVKVLFGMIEIFEPKKTACEGRESVSKGRESACEVHKNACRCNESDFINRESATGGLENVAEAVRVFAGPFSYNGGRVRVVEDIKVPVEAIRLVIKALRVLV